MSQLLAPATTWLGHALASHPWSITQTAVLQALALAAPNAPFPADISTQIAQLLNIHERTAKASLDAIEDAGYLEPVIDALANTRGSSDVPTAPQLVLAIPASTPASKGMPRRSRVGISAKVPASA